MAEAASSAVAAEASGGSSNASPRGARSRGVSFSDGRRPGSLSVDPEHASSDSEAKPVSTVEDLKGVKFRSYSTATARMAFQEATAVSVKTMLILRSMR